MLPVVLLSLQCASNAGTLWSSSRNTSGFSELSLTNGSAIASAPCGDCGRGEQQPTTAVLGGVYYIMRLGGVLESTIELVGYDLTTRKVSTRVHLPHFSKFGGSFAEGVWGLASDDSIAPPGRLLVIGPSGGRSSPLTHTLAAVYPSNGTVVSLGTTALRPIGVSAVTYDAASHVFYTLYGGSDGETAVRGLGPAAETVFDRPIVEFPAVYTLDLSRGRLIMLGLAFSDDGQYRNVLSLDPAGSGGKGTLTTIMNLTDFKQNLPSTTLDQQSNTLVCMLIKQEDNPQLASSLVSIDLVNQTVVAAPQLCSIYYECPATIAFSKIAKNE